jgi:hypothetical protein
VKPSFLMFACLLTNLSIPAAQASDDPQYLIQSCQELVDAYTEADQLRTIAKVASSFSQALRAGYCMGRVDEYRRSYECATDDWFEQAERIAEMPESLTVNELLEHSCAG